MFTSIEIERSIVNPACIFKGGFMLLYLSQHAAARTKEEDPERDLTEKGRLDIEAVAHHLKRLNIEVQQIFHSGKTRARTTAQILADHLQPRAGLTAAPGLDPLDDPEIWARRVADLQENILLVGHLPHLGKLAALLISGDKDKAVINFQMGSVVELKRMDPQQWALDWMIVPANIL
jgi:phosphohistidine phosphatase